MTTVFITIKPGSPIDVDGSLQVAQHVKTRSRWVYVNKLDQLVMSNVDYAKVTHALTMAGVCWGLTPGIGEWTND